MPRALHTVQVEWPLYRTYLLRNDKIEKLSMGCSAQGSTGCIEVKITQFCLSWSHQNLTHPNITLEAIKNINRPSDFTLCLCCTYSRCLSRALDCHVDSVPAHAGAESSSTRSIWCRCLPAADFPTPQSAAILPGYEPAMCMLQLK